jgi:hypothetical protein
MNLDAAFYYQHAAESRYKDARELYDWKWYGEAINSAIAAANNSRNARWALGITDDHQEYA